MNVKEAIRLFKNHQRVSVKEKTRKTYCHLLMQFEERFVDRYLESIAPEELSQYLEFLTEGLAKATRRLRYAQLKAFYNFLIENYAMEMKNPCNAAILSKSFRVPKRIVRQILDKETVDEMIYNTKSDRDRLIMELQARCGLRIGEALKLRVQDISERKLILQNPKSGKDEEIAFMPAHVSKRLIEYVNKKKLSPQDKIFPICYSTARSMVRKNGAKLHVNISPHSLRMADWDLTIILRRDMCALWLWAARIGCFAKVRREPGQRQPGIQWCRQRRQMVWNPITTCAKYSRKSQGIWNQDDLLTTCFHGISSWKIQSKNNLSTRG